MDSNTNDMLTPLFDFTNARHRINQMGHSNINIQMTPQTKRMLHSHFQNGVSETKKNMLKTGLEM